MLMLHCLKQQCKTTQQFLPKKNKKWKTSTLKSKD